MTRAAAKNPPELVMLDCHHKTYFRAPLPEPGDEVWCRLGRHYATVASKGFQYQLSCDSCPVTTSYGQDKDAASRAALRHATKRQGHTVRVLNGGTTVETVTWQGIQEPITGLESVTKP